MNCKYFNNIIAVFTVLIIATGCAAINNKEIKEIETKAQNGDQDAQYKLGVMYDRGIGVKRDLNKAFSWYQQAALQGNPIAQNSLGSMYQFGVNWYKKSSIQGFSEGIVNLGYMYDAGLGVKEDKSHATDLYLKGAEKGNSQGMLNLGLSYYRGEGVEYDVLKAFMWLDLARFYTQLSSNKKMKWYIRGQLDKVQSTMTKEQIAKAKKMSSKWYEEHKTGK